MSRAPFAIRRHLLVKKTTAIPNDPGTLLLRLGYRLGRSRLLHRLLHSLPHLPLVPPRQRLPRQRIRAFRLCLRRFLHSRRQFPELLQPRILLGLYIEFVGVPLVFVGRGVPCCRIDAWVCCWGQLLFDWRLEPERMEDGGTFSRASFRGVGPVAKGVLGVTADAICTNCSNKKSGLPRPSIKTVRSENRRVTEDIIANEGGGHQPDRWRRTATKNNSDPPPLVSA